MSDISLPLKRTPFRAGLAGLLLGLLTNAIVVAEPNYQFDHWTTDDGLPQNAVNAILQTRDGYLWLATFDGLVRFDGTRFTVFNRGNTKGIGGNRFDMLFEDRQGALWAVSDENWLVRYRGGKFTTYKSEDGWPSWLVVRIDEDELGRFQVISRDGIAKWEDGKFRTYSLSDLMAAPAEAKWIQGNMLAKSDANNLYLYANGRFTTHSQKSGLPSLTISRVYVDQYGVIWITTNDVGLVRLKAGQFTIVSREVRPESKGVVQFKDGRFIVYSEGNSLPIRGDAAPKLEDGKGNVWFTGVGNWLGRLHGSRITRYGSTPGFLSSSTMCFYEDREGNVWIGTAYGLYRAREPLISVYTQRDGLSSDNVYSIFEDRAGAVWVGAWGGGLTKYQNGNFTHYRYGLASDLITAIYEDNGASLWIGTTLGLHRLRNDKLQAHPDPGGFFSDGAWVIHEDRKGRFWFGTSNGLIKYSAGQYSRYTAVDGLPSNDVKTILEDRAGRLWFGTWGGLTRFDEDGFVSYTEKDGLASDHIRTLYEDVEGTLWIGTYDGGLSRFKDARFTNYTTNEGLFNNGVFQILEDDRGYFWLSCNRGIYRVSRQELNDFANGKIRAITSVAYDKSDGLLTLECNGGRQPAGWKTRDGRLWFPTAKGVAVIDPNRVALNPLPPPLVIEEVRLNNEAMPQGEVILILAEKNNNLEIRYQGLSFIRPEQQRFKYRLLNIDDDWVDAGSRRTAYYNRLPPGTYTFIVLGTNSDGVWNAKGASVKLKVLPATWQTWWFRLLSGSVVVSIVAFAIRKRIVRRKREQELRDTHSRQLIASQERDRKRIARDLHDGLGRCVNQMSHDAVDGLEDPENYEVVTGRFARIASTAQEAINEMRLVLYKLRPPEIDHWGLTRALEILIERANNCSAINFTCELDQVDSSFDDDGAIHIYRIVQEGLNNIERHSKATEGRILIKHVNDAVRIEITDDGQGFDVAAQAPMNGSEPGLGVPGIIERARLLGGKAEILSASGQGVRIVVTVSLLED